ncbi:metal ABC transporter ATP-binding protein [Caldalkalibacillus salinus]|uniref:metal ABC transporter ATP-binding protein n=1 Tax=Caldalkalibacillus salinus TaxID=2803787 RepID=UPI001922B16B|nr:metal ABC transporter ATP-binding protein [Caldalkalibacillus salinus]
MSVHTKTPVSQSLSSNASETDIPAIEVDNLSVSYDRETVFFPSSVSLQKGHVIGILGPNGAGKSTFLKSIMGLIPKDQGKITFFNQKISKFRKKVAYVPQRTDIDWHFPVLVRDVIMMGRYPLQKWYQRNRQEDHDIVQRCLEKVHLTSFADRQIGQLSGGQQQRVFLARALAQEAELFLLDEPFVGVDATTEDIMVEQLKALKAEGKTILVVHHDLSKANQYFDQLLLINQKVIGYGPVDKMFQPEWLQKTYGGQLTMLSQHDQVTVIH